MISRQKHRLNPSAIFRYDDRHEEGMIPSTPERTYRQPGSADMEVQGSGSVQRSFPVAPAKAARPTSGTQSGTPVGPPKDAVEISSAGQILDKLSKSPEIRAERLAQIKAAIDAGEYDTDEKLEAALMNLLQSIVSNESYDH